MQYLEPILVRQAEVGSGGRRGPKAILVIANFEAGAAGMLAAQVWSSPRRHDGVPNPTSRDHPSARAPGRSIVQVDRLGAIRSRRPGAGAGHRWLAPPRRAGRRVARATSQSAGQRFTGPGYRAHHLRFSTYAVSGAFQFSSRMRRRRPGWHREAGRSLVVLGLAVALSGLWMTQFYARQPGSGGTDLPAPLAVGSGMAASVVLGFAAIRRGDVTHHQAWMTRAYALAVGAGTRSSLKGSGRWFSVPVNPPMPSCWAQAGPSTLQWLSTSSADPSPPRRARSRRRFLISSA